MQWALLRGLADRERREFIALARPRAFGRNEVVCHAGDPADSMHLIEAGHLAVQGILPSGATATFNILSAGDYFGELALLRNDRHRTATVLALEPARTLAISATMFRRLCERQPTVERALSIVLADRIDQLSGRLLETMYVGLDRRVLRRLVELAAAYGEDRGQVGIPLTQSHLADLVGATRPSVNQVLRRLADQGLVELRRGRIEVLDVAAAARRSGA